MEITSRQAAAGGKTSEVFTLQNQGAAIEVWPAVGFNCLRWRIGDQNLLYVAPDWETNPVPTRSGHPILFPFPNRLRNGRFAFETGVYQLPLTDNSGKHAIHGFTPRNAWRVVGRGQDDESCFITGEFCLSQDLPSARSCWPADARIRLTYRLFPRKLRVETTIDAADDQPLPFGLGFHPYFMLDGPLADWQLRYSARCAWESRENFPTGNKDYAKKSLPFRDFTPIGDTALDTLYGDLSTKQPMVELRGSTSKLSIHTDASFRELLVFTPVHRQAVALEPYTCVTDAANLEAQGVDAGWRVLPAGETYSGTVEYHFEPLG